MATLRRASRSQSADHVRSMDAPVKGVG